MDTAADKEVFSKHELMVEMRLTKLDESVSQLKQAIERLERELKEQRHEDKDKFESLRERVLILENSKTWVLGWVAGATLVMTIIAEFLRRYLNI